MTAKTKQRSKISDHEANSTCWNSRPVKVPNSIRVEGFKWQKIHCRKLAAPHDDEEDSMKTKQNKTVESKIFVSQWA